MTFAERVQREQRSRRSFMSSVLLMCCGLLAVAPARTAWVAPCRGKIGGISQREVLNCAAGQAAAAVNTVTEAVASDAAHAISWASRRWSAGALTAGAAAESVAVATLLVELGLVERDAAQAAGAVVRAASFVAELVAREEEPATPSAASVSQQASSQ